MMATWIAPSVQWSARRYCQREGFVAGVGGTAPEKGPTLAVPIQMKTTTARAAPNPSQKRP